MKKSDTQSQPNQTKVESLERASTLALVQTKRAERIKSYAMTGAALWVVHSAFMSIGLFWGYRSMLEVSIGFIPLAAFFLTGAAWEGGYYFAVIEILYLIATFKFNGRLPMDHALQQAIESVTSALIILGLLFYSYRADVAEKNFHRAFWESEQEKAKG